MSIPFSVAIGPSDVVRHPGWVAALKAVQAGLAREGPVVLAGEPGLGKSLLLQVLRLEAERDGQRVILLPGDDADQPGRPPSLILVDDADRVPAALLQHLVRRSPRCVLAGSPALLTALDGLDPAPTLVELRPLLPEEVGPYLQEQVTKAGLPPDLVRDDALAALTKEGGGNPHRLQKLASHGLFCASMEDAEQISAAHIDAALARHGGAPPARAQPPAVAMPAVRHAGPSRPAPSIPAWLPSVPPRAPRRNSLMPGWGLPALGAAIGLACAVLLVTALVPGRHDHPTPEALPPVVAPTPGERATLEAPVQKHDDVPVATAQPASPVPAAPPAPAPVQVLRPAEPEPRLPRPPTPPVHVAVAFAQGNGVAEGRAVSTVNMLQDSGMDAVLSIEPRSARDGSVTYFYANDQAAAAEVARRVGEGGREKLAVARGAPPRPGTVHVVVPSRPAAGQKTP